MVEATFCHEEFVAMFVSPAATRCYALTAQEGILPAQVILDDRETQVLWAFHLFVRCEYSCW